MVWLLCDYGEVLSKAPSEDDKAQLAAAAGWSPARGDFWEAYWLDRPGYDRADLTAEEYWARLLGHPPTAHQLERLVAVDAAGWLHPNELSLEAVRRAGRRGLRLALFSNAPVEVAREIDGALWLSPFTKRFFSCELRAVKPEPAAYLAVLAALEAQPDDVVFFDDRAANVMAAASLGMDARLFEDPAQFDDVATR